MGNCFFQVINMFVDVSKERRSPIWEHFYCDKAKQIAQCMICKEKGIVKILKVTNGSTKSLHDHMAHIHKPKDPNPTFAKKGKMDNFFGRKSLGQTVTELAISGAPFRFIAYCEVLNEAMSKAFLFEDDDVTGKPKNFPKSHSTVRSIIIKHSNKLKGDVIDAFNIDKCAGHRMSITGDSYKSLKNRSYLNLNCHQYLWTGQASQAVITNLGLSRSKGSCPAAKLKSQVTNHLDMFSIDISKDVVAITTDGAEVNILPVSLIFLIS